jgi:hypothetical protein
MDGPMNKKKLIVDVGNLFILVHPAVRLSELKAVLVVLVFRI